MTDNNADRALVEDLQRLRFDEPPFQEVFSVASRSSWSRRWLQITAAVLLVGISVGAAAAAGFLKLPGDPEAGLSDAQRRAIHDQARADAAAFVEHFMASGGDLRSLPRRHESSLATMPADLPTALANASVVVVGTVRSIEITPADGLPNAVVSITVERSIQGDPGPQLDIVQLGGPAQTAGGGVELVDLEWSPLLLPGDRVLLIAEQFPSGAFAGAFFPQPGTGIVYLVGGAAQPLPVSPAVDALTGLTVADAINLYEAGGR
jgi:hypothetical protein